MGDFAKRNEIFTYIDTGTAYELFDAGVLTLDDSLNPRTETEQYIMDAASSTTLDAYEPAFSFTMRVSKTDGVATYIRSLGKALAVGAAAETTIVRFDGWEIEIDGTVAAKQYTVAVALDNTDNGEAGAKIEMAGTLLSQGDPVDGTFDTATLLFTPTIVS